MTAQGIFPYGGVLPRLGKDVYIAPGAIIIGDVEIGDGSSIWFNTVLRGDINYIRIGTGCSIQDNSTLHVMPGVCPVEIGDRVTVGHGCILHGCTVEDDCLIGMGAIVMDGARIGKGSLVAAGAVVTQSFVAPPGSLVIGARAKIARPVRDAEREMINQGAMFYAQLAASYLKGE